MGLVEKLSDQYAVTSDMNFPSTIKFPSSKAKRSGHSRAPARRNTVRLGGTQCDRSAGNTPCDCHALLSDCLRSSSLRDDHTRWSDVSDKYGCFKLTLTKFIARSRDGRTCASHVLRGACLFTHCSAPRKHCKAPGSPVAS